MTNMRAFIGATTVSYTHLDVYKRQYQDPATDESIISIVAPVFGEHSDTVTGFIGIDVFIDSLADSLSQIQVGENGYLELLSSCLLYTST